MTMLTLDLPPDVYLRLHQDAERMGQTVESLAAMWLVERTRHTPARDDLPPPALPGERERARAVLREAGLLTELSPEEKERAARSTATLEEVQAAFARAGGKPLSEIVDEMRGPKE
jgi:hypothetical protein